MPPGNGPDLLPGLPLHFHLAGEPQTLSLALPIAPGVLDPVPDPGLALHAPPVDICGAEDVQGGERDADDFAGAGHGRNELVVIFMNTTDMDMKFEGQRSTGGMLAYSIFF